MRSCRVQTALCFLAGRTSFISISVRGENKHSTIKQSSIKVLIFVGLPLLQCHSKQPLKHGHSNRIL